MTPTVLTTVSRTAPRRGCLVGACPRPLRPTVVNTGGSTTLDVGNPVRVIIILKKSGRKRTGTSDLEKIESRRTRAFSRSETEDQRTSISAPGHGWQCQAQNFGLKVFRGTGQHYTGGRGLQFLRLLTYFPGIIDFARRLCKIRFPLMPWSGQDNQVIAH